MPARTKAAKRQRTRSVAPGPWSGWIDVAVGIGHAVVAYELALAAAALSPVAAVRSRAKAPARLALVHSSDAPTEPAPQHPRATLHAVRRRDEGKA